MGADRARKAAAAEEHSGHMIPANQGHYSQPAQATGDNGALPPLPKYPCTGKCGRVTTRGKCHRCRQKERRQKMLLTPRKKQKKRTGGCCGDNDGDGGCGDEG